MFIITNVGVGIRELDVYANEIGTSATFSAPLSDAINLNLHAVRLTDVDTLENFDFTLRDFLNKIFDDEVFQQSIFRLDIDNSVITFSVLSIYEFRLIQCISMKSLLRITLSDALSDSDFVKYNELYESNKMSLYGASAEDTNLVKWCAIKFEQTRGLSSFMCDDSGLFYLMDRRNRSKFSTYLGAGNVAYLLLHHHSCTEPLLRVSNNIFILDSDYSDRSNKFRWLGAYEKNFGVYEINDKGLAFLAKMKLALGGLK